MKTRSITARNLAGGFFGGFLGILGFGFVHPATLPLGCIIGVLGGWWYQEILTSAIEGWHRGARKTQDIWSRTVFLLITPTKKLEGISINIEPSLKVIRFLVFLVVWTFRSPITFYRWLKRHPMNQAYVIRFFAIIATIELTALWIVPVGFELSQMMEGKGNSPGGILILPVCLLGMTAVISLVMYPVNETESQRHFYSSWSVYSQKGALWFFLREVVMTICFQSAMLVFISVLGFWFIAVGGAFVVLVIAPLSFAIGMVKGAYRVAMRPGHWLCLATTLVVTLISAWQMYSYFADARILWGVALTAGVGSAMATEGLRRLTASFYESNEFIRNVALNELDTQLLSSGKFFWRISQNLGDKCFLPIQAMLK